MAYKHHLRKHSLANENILLVKPFSVRDNIERNTVLAQVQQEYEVCYPPPPKMSRENRIKKSIASVYGMYPEESKYSPTQYQKEVLIKYAGTEALRIIAREENVLSVESAIREELQLSIADAWNLTRENVL